MTPSGSGPSPLARRDSRPVIIDPLRRCGLRKLTGLWRGLVAGDKQIRARVVQSRQTVELTVAESWQLLGSVSLGRVVFTRHAMPAARLSIT